jgi:hypothetical protein
LKYDLSSKTTANFHLLLPNPNLIYQDVAIEGGWCSHRLHRCTTQNPNWVAQVAVGTSADDFVMLTLPIVLLVL